MPDLLIDSFSVAELSIDGAFQIEVARTADDRGYFQRLFENELLKNNFGSIVQTNIALNRVKGTWRGLHYQEVPSQECKFVSCLTGSVIDILFDTREDGKSYQKTLKIELNSCRPNLLFVPSGVAHGYVTLEENTLMGYGHTDFFRSELDAGIRISSLPIYSELSDLIDVMSDRDKLLPDWSFNNGL